MNYTLLMGNHKFILKLFGFILFIPIILYSVKKINIYHFQHKKLMPKQKIIPNTMKKSGSHLNAEPSVEII